jgi:transcription elongation factor
MARVKNPLFSLAATGSVGKITFNGSKNQTTARSKPSSATSTPSAAQVNIRTKCSNAASAWAALSPEERTAWAQKGITKRYAANSKKPLYLANGYALFLKEWHLQNIVPPSIPLRPA